jgi:quercetin dioxygenase-like cupin family protein
MSPLNVGATPPISPLGSAHLVRMHEARTLNAFGETFVILLDGKQTGEKFTAFLSISPPGGGPGPHYHEREDEWFYIVEGQVDFFLDGTWTMVSPGDCVYSPRGSVHGFKIIPISVFACSSIPLPRELNTFSPKQPRIGRKGSPT